MATLISGLGAADSAAPSRTDSEIAAPGAVTFEATQVYTASLRITPSRAHVGEVVDIEGEGYPAGAEVTLVWYTAAGRYELTGGTEFVGQRYDVQSVDLPAIRADRSGKIAAQLEVPADFGGMHDVRARVDGKEIAQAGLTIVPTFQLTPREGPVGTPIELRIEGVDSDPRINAWHVMWDNHYVGFMSAVTTRGVAIARFRAAGPVGPHHLSVWHNSHNPIPYLNWEQGPYRDVPNGDFSFRVTADRGAPPTEVEDHSDRDTPWPVSVAGPGRLGLSVDRGPVGTPTHLSGSGLPASSEIALRWWTMVGNRVWASGFSETWTPLGTVRTDAGGSFELDLPIPDDLGGQHRIEAVVADEVVAAVGLVILPSVVSIAPTRARVGDEVSIHLKGVGWTTYDNVYGALYDNAYIGYVCGFATNGDVRFKLVATGLPGTHLIDFYPMIYKGQDALPRVYARPHLSNAYDHPQRPVPAIRLAIEVVE